jgi:hypothetical protein
MDEDNDDDGVYFTVQISNKEIKCANCEKIIGAWEQHIALNLGEGLEDFTLNYCEHCFDEVARELGLENENN